MTTVEPLQIHSSDHDAFRIGLYYCYLTVVDVDAHVKFHENVCRSRKLNGRVRVSSEGINGVLSGHLELLHEYELVMKESLSNEAGKYIELDIKYCHLRQDLSVDSQLFQDLIVQKTKQVISLVEPQHDYATKKSKRKQKLHSARSDEPMGDFKRVQSIWSKAVEDMHSGKHDATAEYLSPSEWNNHLAHVSNDDDVVIIDCRNFYESNIGHFVCPNASTILTNTRKYQELPQTLIQEKERLVSSKQILMYCTGGVRCERASVFLRTLLEEEGVSRTKIYQLHGGIQRYLQQSQANEDGENYFRGKNFVFDPRRTDPVHCADDVIGVCLVCRTKHDDYDNGHAPSDNKEARCCNCRILILVCNACRPIIACWGDNARDKHQMFCGYTRCLYKPEPRVVKYNDGLLPNIH